MAMTNEEKLKTKGPVRKNKGKVRKPDDQNIAIGTSILQNKRGEMTKVTFRKFVGKKEENIETGYYDGGNNIAIGTSTLHMEGEIIKDNIQIGRSIQESREEVAQERINIAIGKTAKVEEQIYCLHAEITYIRHMCYIILFAVVALLTIFLIK